MGRKRREGGDGREWMGRKRRDEMKRRGGGGMEEMEGGDGTEGMGWRRWQRDERRRRKG